MIDCEPDSQLLRHYRCLVSRYKGSLEIPSSRRSSYAVMWAIVLASALVGLIWYFKTKCSRGTRSLPLPPGPRPLPIIGNVLGIPREKQWLTYNKWASVYGEFMYTFMSFLGYNQLLIFAGDIMYLTVFGQPIIIINSAAAAYEVFEKQSSNFSDRLFTPMMELSVSTSSIRTFDSS